MHVFPFLSSDRFVDWGPANCSRTEAQRDVQDLQRGGQFPRECHQQEPLCHGSHSLQWQASAWEYFRPQLRTVSKWTNQYNPIQINTWSFQTHVHPIPLAFRLPCSQRRSTALNVGAGSCPTSTRIWTTWSRHRSSTPSCRRSLKRMTPKKKLAAEPMLMILQLIFFGNWIRSRHVWIHWTLKRNAQLPFQSFQAVCNIGTQKNPQSKGRQKYSPFGLHCRGSPLPGWRPSWTHAEIIYDDVIYIYNLLYNHNYINI